MDEPTVTLESGDELPTVGVGTWDIGGETVRDAVRAGLDAGYGHVDTAEGYHNEAEIGDVLADYDREEFWLTSKVLPKHLTYDALVESCEASLDRLGTDYLDLYLVHWPNPAVSIRETMDAMASLKERGLVRNVGVSNFSAYQLSCAQHVSDVPIAVNQVEYHPWFQRDDLLDYCRETDTVVEAAAPLARAEVFEDEVVQELAETYDKSPAQVVLKWAVENDVVVLPKSSSPEHVRANRELFDWELEEADRKRLDERDRNHPVYDTPTRDWSRDVYGIAE
ncbi:diketogulonate reductase-like aldo/keto reductase [Halarchaeum rubridurum]|uniref:2,5-didehydrogluconate reductase n=1 Tax=Halarchaeum rubridurum TaxID=489911 RepID=A0A830FPL6_9EURY|nr:aldo/keto reductase [Halarchaeum rubridurum]MBP1954213.1 diketogulonate reductase-like aldo/keto reductase [Halarchaeum rubridurum]GGM58220.1 2,5-didehydrogluconate reductase [Halarchaeum rubridurum]